MEQSSEIKFRTVKLFNRESMIAGKWWISAWASDIPNLRTDFALYTQFLFFDAKWKDNWWRR